MCLSLWFSWPWLATFIIFIIIIICLFVSLSQALSCLWIRLTFIFGRDTCVKGTVTRVWGFTVVLR